MADAGDFQTLHEIVQAARRNLAPAIKGEYDRAPIVPLTTVPGCY